MTKDNQNYADEEAENALKYLKSSFKNMQCNKRAKFLDVRIHL